MAWNAKPSGGYLFSSTEGTENVLVINGMLNARGYTLEAQAGVIGNAMAESALNPWRWQGNTVNYNAGYGLFQYTPASSYIDGAVDVEGYAPNLSVDEITIGAHPDDGNAQIITFDENILGSWVGSCWRSYWDTTEYADLYRDAQHILRTYGNGSYLSISQFRAMDSVYYATLAFLACFEGPARPLFEQRYANALIAYDIIGGDTPEPPVVKRKMPIWLYLKPF